MLLKQQNIRVQTIKKKQTWNNANENKCKKKINCFVKNMCKIPINPYEQFLFTINCWKLNNTLK